MNAAGNALANPVDVAYLITGILFIIGLRYLSSPRRAAGQPHQRGGMLIACARSAEHVNWM